MTESPLVSVVLGTYNGETFLEEQLRSVLAQTWEHLEIIAIDDCSTDRTVAILREYAAKDSRIRVVVNEQNLGFIRNFEKGARLSTGKWIAFCDQDDFWLPEKVERMVREIGDYPMIYCDSELCGPDLRKQGKKISEIVHYQSFHDCRQLCVFSRMYGHATLITRALFEKASPFVTEMPHDGWLAYHATLFGGVKYLPEALVKYRQHAANVFGVVGRRRKKDRSAVRQRAEKRQRVEKRRKELARIRFRMNAFCAACPDSLAPQKKLLTALVESYRSFSLRRNFMRVYLFLANYHYLLVVKKYSRFRKYLFCLKMFVKIK
ncbi:MAG TPA: glycosyltransferase family 2 protein [Puia sp.]|nr:glycosyltransferase family 2 protein [Puia sp.]